MKKIVIFILCLAFTLFCGCSSTNTNVDNNGNNTDFIVPILPDLEDTEDKDQSTEEVPVPEINPPADIPIVPEVVPPTTPDIGGDNDVFDEEQEEKKKLYIRSNANALRVRSKNSLSSTVLGTLDKNDMLNYKGTDGSFYVTEFKEQTAYVYSDMCTLVEMSTESDKIEDAIDLGAKLLGHPYIWGSQRYHWGNGVLNKNFKAGEFDCSALVQYVYYKSCGVILDVTSRAQSLNGTAVKKADLKRGDLMFFTNASRINKTGIERIGHLGIYFGDNYILHTASDNAVIEPISSLRWSYYVTARRVV